MILNQLSKNETAQSIMINHRHMYNKIKALVTQRKFDLLNTKQINDQKQLVIQHLNSDDQAMYDQFEELTFYQQRYLTLSKFLVNMKKDKGVIDIQETDKLVSMFEEHFQPDKISNVNNNNNNNKLAVGEKRQFKAVDSFQIDQRNQKLPFNNYNNTRLNNAGLGQAVFQFFDKKQRESKNVGFKDLIEKNINVSSKTHNFKKKQVRPSHDIQIRKLLQQNKRLHIQLQKKSREDVQLNQFEKNVLREQKDRCMKRIQQLEEQIQQLARNNYKLQQIQKTRKAVTTFVDDSVGTQKNQILPYCIPTRHNDLNVITEKNKLSKINGNNKDNILLNLVSQIPPIQKKQDHSFEDELNKFSNQPKVQNNNILADLLQDKDENPKRQLFTGPNEIRPPQKNAYYGGQQVRYSQPGSSSRYNKPNQSLDNGNRFDSFSMAQTAYNNSEMFLNASKNLIAIDSMTSTRNKVAFFKNSLVIVKDNDFQIAFKRSHLDPTLTKARLIFYINNKTKTSEAVSIQYDYEINYYSFYVTEKLKFIPTNQQSRQVVQISLVPSCPDLNSVIDVHITIGQKRYDLWVPICFIQWTADTLVSKQQVGFMTIQPDRQFANYENAAKVLLLSRKIMPNTEQAQAFLYGRSRFGNHQVKLTWWQKQLTVDAGVKILDFLGFIMHHFK